MQIAYIGNKCTIIVLIVLLCYDDYTSLVSSTMIQKN